MTISTYSKTAALVLAFAVAALVLVLPQISHAAADDVTLTTDVVLSVNGATINVSGSSATVETIEVGATSFTVTLADTSTIEITAPDLDQLNASTATDQTTNTCNSTSSVLKYVATAARTIVITPQGTCTGSGTGGGSTGGGGSSGGGSPSPASTPTPVTPLPVTTTPAPTQASATTGSVAALLAQLQSLIQLYISLGGTVTPEMAAFAGGGSASFTRDLDVGSTGDDALSLQQYLNSKGYMVAGSGPGSPGNETTMFGGLTRAAHAEIQAANGITPSDGHFCPQTRAFINANP